MFHTSILTKKITCQNLRKKLQAGPDKAIRSMDDSAVTRYDQYKTGSYVNTAMYMGTNSTSYYFSVANGNISRFFDEMYLNTPWDYHYSSLDGRSILDRLASVKYFAIKKSGYGYLPYGYDSEAAVTKKYRIYEDEDSLPIGYTYDSWIPREKYEKLSVTEKQQALLQGAVLEDSSLSETDLTFDDKKADFTLEAGKGCKIKDGKIIVKRPYRSDIRENRRQRFILWQKIWILMPILHVQWSVIKMGFHDRI